MWDKRLRVNARFTLRSFCVFCVALIAVSCVDVTTNVERGLAGAEQRLVSREQLPLNHFQFFGSHNSYKTAIDPQGLAALRALNPVAASALEYWHEPIHRQLELGLRVLELDVFYDPQQTLFGLGGEFPVLHVQNVDTGSHCAELLECIEQIVSWSEVNSGHEPILISFNAKTDAIDQPGFIVPKKFDAAGWRELDATLRAGFGSKILNPAQVLTPGGPAWPSLLDARGRVLLLLDEGPEKHEAYLSAVKRPAMFANVSEGDPRAAIRVLNDPVADLEGIRQALEGGLLVRTRADADTREARTGDVARRDAAFASGAHFVSTDYYLPATHFGTGYVVELPGGGSVRCNPRVGARSERELCEASF